MAIKSSTVSAKESSKMVLSDFLSVPKIIGTGPIIMAPPPYFSFLGAYKTESKRTASTMMSTPTKINAMPSA